MMSFLKVSNLSDFLMKIMALRALHDDKQEGAQRNATHVNL
jgi:hypothetical protein